MMKARSLAVVVLVSLPLSLSVLPAGARPPIGNCPPAFQGPLTFQELIERWPPPPDLPDPIGVLNSFDKNDDDMLCVMEAVDAAPSPINVIDNSARVP
jgi:hypothetical protein